MSRHNFLNESFAEYESWLALQEVYGDSLFEEQLTEARKTAQKAPSFYEWKPRFDMALSYNKGPVLLHELRQRIGKSDYQLFVRSLQNNDTGTLGEMIGTLEEVTNSDTATWFRKKL
jgi:aminopeptidase N